jgi:hypothetical protein
MSWRSTLCARSFLADGLSVLPVRMTTMKKSSAVLDVVVGVRLQVVVQLIVRGLDVVGRIAHPVSSYLDGPRVRRVACGSWASHNGYCVDRVPSHGRAG